MPKPLTTRQREVVDYVRGYLNANGYPPSSRDIARALSVTPNAVYHHLDACERKGVLRRSHGVARGIKLLDARSQERQP